MPDEFVNHDEDRAFAAFLDRLVAGEPGADGVDPALAETARDLQDRAARSTASAPPDGLLASIRAGLFEAPIAPGRHRAMLGIVPGPALLTRPALQLALAAAVLLAVLTGFATFHGTGWLGHVPTGTRSALAATATVPTRAQLAMSPDNGSTAARFVASATASPAASPAEKLSPEAQSLLSTCAMPTGTRIPQEQEFFTPWGLGKAPLWMDGWGNPPAELQRRLPEPGASYTGEQFAGPTQLGWFMRVLWVMDQTNTFPVTLHGERISDGALMLFDTTYGHPVESATLNPANPGIPVQHGGFREWPSNVYFPGSGCFQITATWEGGSWTEQIAVIVPTTPSRCSSVVTPGTTPVVFHAGTPVDIPAPAPKVQQPGENPCASPASATPAPSAPVASPAVSTSSTGRTCPMPEANAIDLPATRGGQVIHAWGLGRSPLWLVGLGETPGWYRPTDPGFVVSGAKASFATPTGGGNATNVLWLMDPAHPQPITVQGKNVETGAALLFQTGGTRQPTSTVSFTPGPGVGRGTVLMWWTDLIYPEPGCYELTATWTSGAWTIRLPLPAPANAIATPIACVTPGATPSLAGEPGNLAQSLMQPPPPFATKQPPIPYITPGIQQIMTPPSVPLITPTPFATIIVPAATPACGP